MEHTITIDRRFRGPPASANGGYSCGVVAATLGPDPTTVTLRRPPPLARPLRAVVDGDDAVLLDGDSVVAEARRATPADAVVETPEPVSFDAALATAERFDMATYRSNHVFPGCYTCGPDRAEGDGLRIFPGAMDTEGVVAWPWTPGVDDPVDADGLLEAPVVWAALDCPSGLAWLSGGDGAVAVLGRMTVAVHRRPTPGARLVVAGWRATAERRKLVAGSAIWSADGETLAENRAVWVRLDEEQQDLFTASERTDEPRA